MGSALRRSSFPPSVFRTLLALRKGVPWATGAFFLFLSVRYISRHFQWERIFALFQIFRPFEFFIGAGLSILAYWAVRALRWFVLLRSMGWKIPWSELYLCSSLVLCLANFTPARSGEILKVEWLKRRGLLDRIPGYGSLIVERLADLGIVCLFAAVGLFLQGSLPFDPAFLPLVFCLGIAAILLILRFLKRRDGDIRKRLFPDALDRRILRFPVIARLLFLTGAGWCITAFGWHMSLLSLSIDIGYPRAILLVCLTTLVSIGSFLPGAIGVAEVCAAEILMHFGQDAPSAQAGALIIRANGILVLFLGGMHLIPWMPLRRSATEGNVLTARRPLATAGRSGRMEESGS